jgi:hypothetical protein
MNHVKFLSLDLLQLERANCTLSGTKFPLQGKRVLIMVVAYG